MSDLIFLCSLWLFYIPLSWYRHPLYYVALLVLTVFSIMSLFFIIYISSIFEPFLLLWSSFKHFFLLRSLVQPLPLRFLPTSTIFCIMSRLPAVFTSSFPSFFGAT